VRIAIDSNVFLSVVFEDPGWEHCGKLLDSVHSGEHSAIVSAIQLSELFTPFERIGDSKTIDLLSKEIEKSKIRIRNVDEIIARVSAQIRSTEKTPKGDWLPLADSIILATSQVEHVDTLYTLDMDFMLVEGTVKVRAPDMTLDEWEQAYAVPRKRRKIKG
jgi:predicted nucleic acid-binding protein